MGYAVGEKDGVGVNSDFIARPYSGSGIFGVFQWLEKHGKEGFPLRLIHKRIFSMH
jgi:hypothetical protein